MRPTIKIDGEVVHDSPKVVLFDKDGTLIDIHHYWASMIRIRADYIVRQWFQSQDMNDQRRIHDQLVDAMGVDLRTGKMKPDGPVGIKPRPFIVNVAAESVQNEGVRVDNDQMELLFEDVDQATSLDMLPLLKILPGVKRLLKSLKGSGVLSVVVSTDITGRAKKAMEVLGLEEYFAFIIGGDLVENTKPAPDLAHLALEQANCNENDALVIGDHPVDIGMGETANVPVNIGVLTGLSSRDAFAQHDCYIIDDLSSIEIDRVQGISKNTPYSTSN